MSWDKGFCDPPFANFEFELSVCDSTNESCNPNVGLTSAMCYRLNPDVPIASCTRGPFQFDVDDWRTYGDMICYTNDRGESQCATNNPKITIVPDVGRTATKFGK